MREREREKTKYLLCDVILQCITVGYFLKQNLFNCLAVWTCICTLVQCCSSCSKKKLAFGSTVHRKWLAYNGIHVLSCTVWITHLVVKIYFYSTCMHRNWTCTLFSWLLYTTIVDQFACEQLYTDFSPLCYWIAFFFHFQTMVYVIKWSVLLWLPRCIRTVLLCALVLYTECEIGMLHGVFAASCSRI